MQLMSWVVGRLGSRFALMFEPYERRVMHSALGRFLDQPLDLAVGLVEPDGTERVLPFTRDDDRDGVEQLANCEQFERVNSITFRGYSERYRLRMDLNVHAVFYPQNDRLCQMPAFYMELRVHPIDNFRNIDPVGPPPRTVQVFIRLRRPDTQITVDKETIGMTYQVPLQPAYASGDKTQDDIGQDRSVTANERIRSLNDDCKPTPEGDGLTLELPVTAAASGVKWRFVWAAHVAEPVLTVKQDGETRLAKLRYNEHWANVDQVLDEAVQSRDGRLALSRRFEKLLDQAPFDAAQTHLLNQSFQNFLVNTFWATTFPPSQPDDPDVRGEWFSTWDGNCLMHSPVDVEYNCSAFYLTLWPRLLKLLLLQWLQRVEPHADSGGVIMPHDLGIGVNATANAYNVQMPVEENANLLLLLETYTHWTGDRSISNAHVHTVGKLAKYLVWTDRDASGFPSEGVANTLVDASPAMHYGRKQTYLAVKRVAALRAAAGILHRTGQATGASQLDKLVDRDVRRIEQEAWLGDHYAVVVDSSAVELTDPRTGQPLPYDKLPGWDAYSIYTGNGLLLPEMIGHPPLLDRTRLTQDVYAATREAQGRYGDGHSSYENNNCRISQALWRDILARYLHLGGASSAQQYWDLQVMSNTHRQSMGYTDTYVTNSLTNYPRGIVTLAYFLSTPRLMIDRLSPGATGTYITVDPDRRTPQRWPLLPLADWQAGKVPVCVVDDEGSASIEAMTDPVVIHGVADDPSQTISDIEFIG